MRPDRIVIGEMRDGAAALETLKAWNTGHPGGLSTLHANSAAEALPRLEDLLQEVVARPSRRAIAQALDVLVLIRRVPGGRRVDAVLQMQDLQSGALPRGHAARRGQPSAARGAVLRSGFPSGASVRI